MEAALILPLILGLSFGVAEYGYAFYLKHALQAATCVGVRMAILPGSTDTAVQSAVAQQLALDGMPNLSYTLTTVPSTVVNCASGTPVSVTVSCTWGNAGINVLPVSMGGLPATKQLAAGASMVHE